MTNNHEEEVKFIHYEDGVWRIDPWGKSLVEPSQEWIDENTIILEVVEPTQEDYLLDLDYRLSLIELGLLEV